MRKPIIGIIGKVQPQYEEDIWHRIDEVDEIRYLIVRNGGTAIMLLPTEETLKFNDNDIKDNTILSTEEKNELYRQIDLCDGFILQGGLCSANYEIEMAKRIIELDKPLIKYNIDDSSIPSSKTKLTSSFKSLISSSLQ